jgi:hypothetical protein
MQPLSRRGRCYRLCRALGALVASTASLAADHGWDGRPQKAFLLRRVHGQEQLLVVEQIDPFRSMSVTAVKPSYSQPSSLSAGDGAPSCSRLYARAPATRGRHFRVRRTGRRLRRLVGHGGAHRLRRHVRAYPVSLSVSVTSPPAQLRRGVKLDSNRPAVAARRTTTARTSPSITAAWAGRSRRPGR